VQQRVVNNLINQNTLLAAISKQAALNPQKQAIEGLHYSLVYAELAEQVKQTIALLNRLNHSVIGLFLENSPAWIVIDLAAQAVKKTVVPLPLFFSDDQLRHVIADAEIGLLFTDNPSRLQNIALGFIEFDTQISHPNSLQTEAISLFQQPQLADCNPDLIGVGKITYTSGTTGTPKGVCLSNASTLVTSEALKTRTLASPDDRHLCLTPLSTLLENIAGSYVPLLSGSTVIVLPSAKVGLQGASGLDIKQLLSALINYQVSSAIVIPQMLIALVSAIEAGMDRPKTLRFLAVGGAPVSEHLLARARRCKLPVFQGYGLSECASVVAVNSPTENRIGSVGKPLPHLEVRFSKEGEILVKGALFSGYLGSAAIKEGVFWPTGDLGYQDEAGYLWVTGRKKSLFITSFGRNIAPEWIESEFSLHPAIQQIVVFGEGRAWNCAVIVSQLLATAEGQSEIERLINTVNQQLPDYAQVRQWIAAKAPFSVGNGQWTGTNRPRREPIFDVYKQDIEQLYRNEDKR